MKDDKNSQVPSFFGTYSKANPFETPGKSEKWPCGLIVFGSPTYYDGMFDHELYKGAAYDIESDKRLKAVFGTTGNKLVKTIVDEDTKEIGHEWELELDQAEMAGVLKAIKGESPFMIFYKLNARFQAKYGGSAIKIFGKDYIPETHPSGVVIYSPSFKNI